jgi:hypothetical protein
MGRSRGVRAETQKMKYSQRLAAAALVVLMTMTLSACAGRWFDIRPQHKDAEPVANASNDFNAQAAAYVRDLCALPREERDTRVRALNEALLPNHANISCGRGGSPDE